MSNRALTNGRLCPTCGKGWLAAEGGPCPVCAAPERRVEEAVALITAWCEPRYGMTAGMQAELKEWAEAYLAQREAEAGR